MNILTPMRAARIHRFGPPNIITIERTDVPEPRDREVLVRVRAAGVGPWDALVRKGMSGLPQTSVGFPIQLPSNGRPYDIGLEKNPANFAPLTPFQFF
jgi:NADPH:quinone reductase-like Zn-dependent oxidoreductase